MNYKNIIILSTIVIFFGGFAFAQSKPETPNITITAVCSNLSRTQATPQTYQDMYNPSDLQKEYFKSINWNKTVVGAEARYDNTRSIQNSCKEGFLDGELGGRNTFWDTYFSIYKTFFSTNDTRSSPSFYQPANIGTMQAYIKWACGLTIKTDGQLGKKTVNSVQICKTPPAGGKLSRADFDTLAKTKTALFVDPEGKIPIYNGIIFDTNFKPNDIYVDVNDTTAKGKGIINEATAITKGLKVVKKDTTTNVLCLDIFGSVTIPPDAKEEGGKCCYAGNNVEGGPNLNTSWSVQGLNATYTPTIQPTNLITPIPGSITIPICGKSTDTNSAAVCRFKPQAGVIPTTEYITAKANEIDYKIPTDCNKGCDGGYTEVKKGGISICEKCDIEKCNCGIKLNTNIPFIGRCIMNEKTNNVGQNGDTTTVNSLNAFPILMGALIKLLMSIIMIVCFASLIVGGFMMTVPDQYDTGKGIVKKVIRTIVALGSLGTILYLINPNFFS